METKEWDVFISHAAEDKVAVARPLAASLRRAGARVWLDEHELTVGDSLSEKIDEGLARSQFGVVILTPAFFAKHWPKRELAGLRAREEEGIKVILPVWHNVDKPAISRFSPILADALAAKTEQGIDNVAKALIRVIFPATGDEEGSSRRSPYRRLVEILESEPDKEVLVEFLSFHWLDGRRLGWRGDPITKKVELGGVVFDAYATDHHLGLTLVYFTEIWKDPFTTDPESEPMIHGEIMDVASKIHLMQRSLPDELNRDPSLQSKVLSLFASSWDSYGTAKQFPMEYYRENVSFLRPEFYVYAGRRSEIDASVARHNIWLRLRNPYRNIVIRTYDSLLDAIQPG
jgi:hypothetical protein